MIVNYSGGGEEREGRGRKEERVWKGQKRGERKRGKGWRKPIYTQVKPLH